MIRHVTLCMRARPPFFMAGICLLLYSCSLDDCRDACCPQEPGIVMEYRYMYRNNDVFPQYIHKLDHYLFDDGGNFLAMLPPGEKLNSQSLDLAPGKYTIVTVGNSSGQIISEGYAEEGLDGFMLKVIGQESTQAVRDGETGQDVSCGELYSGFEEFTVTDSPSQRFITEMSNIHCQLDVRVEWESRPPVVGDYRIILWNVPCCYNMDCKDASTVGGHDFPDDMEEERDGYRMTVPLKSQTLKASFVTLRYTSECIPSLRVYIGREAVTPVLDLTRAFQQWGWNPDRDTVQNYRISITVHKDGTVSVRPWTDGEVSDWIDGGHSHRADE